MNWIKEHWKILAIFFVVFVAGYFTGGVAHRFAIENDFKRTCEYIKCKK